MLTRDLLLFTVRKGRVRPRFVKTEAAELRALAEDLVAIAEAAPGEPKREVDEAMGARALAHEKPKVAKGLVKLLQDRLTVAEPDASVMELRWSVFEAATRALSSVESESDEDAFSLYKEGIVDALGSSLEGAGRAGDDETTEGRVEALRRLLHADLPSARCIEAFDAIDASGLLDRYNLALAQGLVMYARQLELEIPPMERPEVRRLLRWLRFCRLVAEVRSEKDVTHLLVEGPAALFEGAKGYGLQLATFLTVVPTLDAWQLRCQVELPRRPPAELELTESDPLVSSFRGGAGYVPAELTALLERTQISGWTIDVAPAPRRVGATDLAVPDLALVPEESARPTIAVELFHRWHRGVLERRLLALSSRPDPTFRVGVDRRLIGGDTELSDRVTAHPATFVFRHFPSPRTLTQLTKDVT